MRVFPATPVRDDCSCNREKIRGVLQGFSADDLAHSTQDGRIQVTCEFCGEAYEFSPTSSSRRPDGGGSRPPPLSVRDAVVREATSARRV